VDAAELSFEAFATERHLSQQLSDRKKMIDKVLTSGTLLLARDRRIAIDFAC